MLTVLVALLLAALAYWVLVALTHSVILGIVAAVLVLVAGFGRNGYDHRL